MELKLPRIRIPRIRIHLETAEETRMRKLAKLKAKQAKLHKAISKLVPEP